MEYDGSKLRKVQEDLEISTIDVAVAAELHPQTVYRVYLNDPKVSRKSVNLVRKALVQLQERLAPSKSKAAG